MRKSKSGCVYDFIIISTSSETARSSYFRDTLHTLLSQVPSTVRRVVVVIVYLRPGTKLLRRLERIDLLGNVRVLVVVLAALGLKSTLAPLELDPVIVRVVIRATRAEAAVLERHFDFTRYQDLGHVDILKNWPKDRQRRTYCSDIYLESGEDDWCRAVPGGIKSEAF